MPHIAPPWLPFVPSHQRRRRDRTIPNTVDQRPIAACNLSFTVRGRRHLSEMLLPTGAAPNCSVWESKESSLSLTSKKEQYAALCVLTMQVRLTSLTVNEYRAQQLGPIRTLEPKVKIYITMQSTSSNIGVTPSVALQPGSPCYTTGASKNLTYLKLLQLLCLVNCLAKSKKKCTTLWVFCATPY